MAPSRTRTGWPTRRGVQRGRRRSLGTYGQPPLLDAQRFPLVLVVDLAEKPKARVSDDVRASRSVERRVGDENVDARIAACHLDERRPRGRRVPVAPARPAMA